MEQQQYIVKQDKCLLCMLKFKLEYGKSYICIRCNASYHSLCYDKHSPQQDYTQCPYCEKIGCIGVYGENDAGK